MRIDRLEIKGFKSFPDKTVLKLKPGITAVVGPNGCGKSNVLDSIRWVMGEQRVRSLRGKKMEDVIFNGADSRKAVGLAEVKLILSGAKGLGPPSLKDYDEIMITRRLFRDGESQYEINNVPCRLSDITDFFLDTGVGRNSYAIIEQGRVDMVVASKPEDRRRLIEEAAGIARYKARKEAALKKLEQTKQNLLRISDVISEVKRQSASLKRQAAKANKYRNLTQELRDIDLRFHAYKAQDLNDLITKTKSQHDSINDSLGDASARKGEIDAHLERAKVRSLEYGERLTKANDYLHKIEIELREQRSRNKSAESRLAQLKERKSRSQASLLDMEKRNKDSAELISRLKEQQSTVQKELEALRSALTKSEEESHGIREKQKIQWTKIEKLKEEIFGLLQAASHASNNRESLNRRLSDIDSEIKRLTNEKDGLEGELREKKSTLDALATEQEGLETQKNKIHEGTQVLEKSKSELSGKISDLNKLLVGIEKDLGRKGDRLSYLNELQSSFSSYAAGVRYLLADESPWSESSIVSPLGELVDTTNEYQPALLAAIGDKIDYLVVESLENAIDAVKLLEESGAGRVTFAPMNSIVSKSEAETFEERDVKALIELVSVKEGYESIVEAMLNNTVLVRDLRGALDLFKDSGKDLRIVTLDGAKLDEFGALTGGPTRSIAEEVFNRRNEIRSLESEINHRQGEMDVLNDQFNEADMEMADVNNRLEELRAESADIKLQDVRIRKDMETLEEDTKKGEMRIKVLDMEIQRFEKERQEVNQGGLEAERKIIEVTDKKAQLEKEKEEAQKSLDEINSKIGEMDSQVGDDRIRVAKLEERVHSLGREIESETTSRDRTLEGAEALKGEMDEDEQESLLLISNVKTGAANEKELMEKNRTGSKELEELKEKTHELTERIKRLETEASEMDRQVISLKDQSHGLETEIVRSDQSLQDMVEKVVERYGVDPRTVEIVGERPGKDEIVSIREKIEAMGQVNLAAIVESKHTEERLEFLVEQEEDLQAAVESLYTTINKINRTTKDRFKETFDKINGKFQEMFPFLFRGGEARLELTDAENLLESGVDILARPPGKRIQNMSLLSGGEKALTAVALIFSIFLIRPSPFCLLDEVDAPLDDANLARFNDMLRTLSGATQFILITHSKASMEMADTLYGITMAEAGVSNVVSVEFMDTEAV